MFVFSDCTTRQGDISSIFVKTSDAIVFHFDEHNGHFNIEQFTFSRMQSDRRKEICRFDIMADYPSGYLYRENCSSNSNNRTSVVFIDADRDYMIFDVTISKAEKADNGTYMIVSEFSPWISKCFTVFILGRYLYL